MTQKKPHIEDVITAFSLYFGRRVALSKSWESPKDRITYNEKSAEINESFVEELNRMGLGEHIDFEEQK